MQVDRPRNIAQSLTIILVPEIRLDRCSFTYRMQYMLSVRNCGIRVPFY